MLREVQFNSSSNRRTSTREVIKKLIYHCVSPSKQNTDWIESWPNRFTTKRESKWCWLISRRWMKRGPKTSKSTTKNTKRLKRNKKTHWRRLASSSKTRKKHSLTGMTGWSRITRWTSGCKTVITEISTVTCSIRTKKSEENVRNKKRSHSKRNSRKSCSGSRTNRTGWGSRLLFRGRPS